MNLPAHLVIIKVSQIMYIKVHKFAEEITHFFTCAIDVRKNWEFGIDNNLDFLIQTRSNIQIWTYWLLLTNESLIDTSIANAKF